MVAKNPRNATKGRFLRIKSELKKLTEERQAYIKAQREKLGAGKKSLDDKLLGTLKEQAKDKGLKYEKENDY